MPTTYYVDPRIGNDANDGTSPDSPFASLTAVNELSLQPGDTVLLACGATFAGPLVLTDSGTVFDPITIGAYGDGDKPVITGAARGIHGSKTEFIVIEDLAIRDTGDGAIYAGRAANWTIDNVSIFDTPEGGATKGISFQQGSNLTVRNSTIEDVRSDGIWIDGVNGVLLENNRIGTVYGSQSDNIQVVNSQDVEVRGNTMEIAAGSDSTKGNLVVNNSVGVVVADNAMIGGGYGASINSDDVSITGNEIYGQGGYSWSFGIGIGERWSVKDYVIADNYVHDVRWGVAVTGIGDTPVFRENVEITGNVFENTEGAAIKIDRPASGFAAGNYVDYDSPPLRLAGEVAESGQFTIENPQRFVSSDPTGNLDLAMLGETEGSASGNVLINDESLSDLQLEVSQVEGTTVDGSTTVSGRYGDLTILEDGTYLYALDDARMMGVSSQVTERFAYGVSDGRNEGLGELVVTIDPRPNVVPSATTDLFEPNGFEASGNVLWNDTDGNGDALSVVSVAGAFMTPQGIEVEGRFGTLTIAADGSVDYDLDPVRSTKVKSDTLDTFPYVVSDGRGGFAGSTLAISIEAPKALPPQKPVAVNDVVRLDAQFESLVRGNILANDYDLNGSAVMLRTVGSTKVGDREVVISGKYGDLFVERDGDYRYVVDTEKVAGLSGNVVDSFFYKVSDGALQDTASLAVKVALGPDPFAIVDIDGVL